MVSSWVMIHKFIKIFNLYIYRLSKDGVGIADPKVRSKRGFHWGNLGFHTSPCTEKGWGRRGNLGFPTSLLPYFPTRVIIFGIAQRFYH